MRKIKCSRCHNNKEVPDDWKYRECISCHLRTLRRFKIKPKWKPVSEEKIMLRGLGVMTKSQFLKLKGHRDPAVAEHDWITYQNEMRQQLRDLTRLFHIDKYPLGKDPNFCLKFRMKLKRRYLDGDESAIDGIEIQQHVSCKSCMAFLVALKSGSLEGVLPEEKEFAEALDMGKSTEHD
jgi:hypothetical protein